MSAGAIIAGQVAIEAQVKNVNKASQDLNRLDRNLKKVEQTTSAMGSAIKGFKGFVSFLVAANVIQRNLSKLNKVIRETIDKIDNLDKGSQRLGLTVQQYRSLSLSAEMAGASIEQFETAFVSMQRNIANLALTESGGEARGAFEQLGIDMQQLLDMDPGERFLTIAGALQEFNKHGDRAGLVMRIFGESGVRLLPMLDKGEEGLRGFIEQMEEFTGVISPEVASEVARMRDAVAIWDSAILSAQANLLTLLLPALTDLIVALVSASAIVEKLDLSFPNAVAGALSLQIFGKELTLIETVLHLVNAEVTRLNAIFKMMEGLVHTAAVSIDAMRSSINALDRAVSQTLADNFGFFGDGFQKQADAANERLEKSNKSLDQNFQRLKRNAIGFKNIGQTAKEGFDEAADRAARMNEFLDGVRETALKLRKELGIGQGEAPKNIGGAIAEIPKKIIDMSKAFAGEAVRMGTASSEVQLKQMQNRQIEILKRIEENTAVNVVVGV